MYSDCKAAEEHRGTCDGKGNGSCVKALEECVVFTRRNLVDSPVTISGVRFHPKEDRRKKEEGY